MLSIETTFNMSGDKVDKERQQWPMLCDNSNNVTLKVFFFNLLKTLVLHF